MPAFPALPAETFRLSHNVVVRGFKADVVPTYEDKLSERKARQGEIYRAEVHNLIVNVGLNLIMSRLRSNTDNFVQYNGVGSSTSSPSDASKTDLVTPIGSRKVVTSAYPGATGVGNWDTFYTAPDNPGSWNEVALFNAISSGVMYARVVLPATFTKIDTGLGANTASVDWSSTVTAT